MAKEHLVRDNDTIQHLALLYLGDANLWKDIAGFNSLDYPYITSDINFQTSVKASGTATITMSKHVSKPVRIPQGTEIFALTIHGDVIKFTTMTLVVIATGTQSINLNVECTHVGMLGNIKSRTLAGFSDIKLSGVLPSFSTGAPRFEQGGVLIERAAGARANEIMLLPSGLLSPIEGTLDIELEMTEAIKTVFPGSASKCLFSILGSGLGGEAIYLQSEHNTSNFSLLTLSETQASAATFPKSSIPNGRVMIRVSWTRASVNIFVNNTFLRTISNPHLPQSIGQISVGSRGGSHFIDGRFYKVICSSIQRGVESTFTDAVTLDRHLTYYNDFSSNLVPVTLTTNNETAFTNGIELNVKKTGDTILIPLTEELSRELAEELVGRFSTISEDLLLMDGDLVEDPHGDTASVRGVNNIALSLKLRLETERGELTHHPNYGSNLHTLVGKTEPFIRKLIEIDVIDTILQDHNLKEVEITELSVQGDTVNIVCSVTLTDGTRANSVVINPVIG